MKMLPRVKSTTLAIACTAILGLSGVTVGTALAAEKKVLEAETMDVAKLPPTNAHRLFSTGGRGNGVMIIDTDKPGVIGVLHVGGYGNFEPAHDNSFYYLAESIWTRGNRGTRQDILSIYDGTTLNLVAEVDLPGRLLSTPKGPNFALSQTSKYAYLFNLEPAASVVMVDLATRTVMPSIEIPACGMIYPYKDEGFASLCGNGTLASVFLGANGTPEISHTSQFFDPENDPILDEAVVDRETGQAFFVSFTGTVHPVILGKTPQFQPTWSLQRAAGYAKATTAPEHETWRPGGMRFMAYHKKSGKLYVVMHEGLHWTQKEGGSEVWVFDTKEQKLLHRLELPQPTRSIAISQDDKPQLYAVSGNTLWVLNPETGRVIRDMRGVSGGLMSVPGF